VNKAHEDSKALLGSVTMDLLVLPDPLDYRDPPVRKGQLASQGLKGPVA